MNWTNFFLVVLLTALATMFAMANMQFVQVGFLGLYTPRLHLYVVLYLIFIFGFMAGMATLSLSRRKHKKEIVRLREENRLLTQELENLRNFPLQDDL